MFPLWTMPRRRALLMLSGVVWIALMVQWARNRAYLPESPDYPAPRANELSGKIDPNSADWQTLAAIPSMGEKKAQAIVAYREHQIATGQRPPIFREPADLEQIKGIGRSTAENLSPYLAFPTTSAISR